MTRIRLLHGAAATAIGGLLALGLGLGLAPVSVAAQAPAPDTDGAHFGYLAARLVDGELEVLDARNADGRFVPASVLKVATVAAALEHLGPDYRWVTRLTSRAPMDGPVLVGDLVIEAGGAPPPRAGGGPAGPSGEPSSSRRAPTRPGGRTASRTRRRPSRARSASTA